MGEQRATVIYGFGGNRGLIQNRCLKKMIWRDFRRNIIAPFGF